MKKTTIKILYNLLRFISLLLLANDQCLGEEIKASSDLSYRMSEIEAQSRQQKKEIELLKTAADKDRQVIHELSGRVALLEVSAPPASPSNDENLQRPKRSYQLLPPKSFREENQERTDDDDPHQMRFYGPATNCNELGKIGYTLNGYYLVNSDLNDQSNTPKIRVVYCTFQNLKESTQDLETLIGNELQLKRKTSLVHFHVENRIEIQGTNIIRFKKEQINIGKAMNLSNGIFTAPFPGVYHFQFTGLKDNSRNDLYVNLKVNDITHAVAYADEYPMYLPLYLGTSLHLLAGDQVFLHAGYNLGPALLYEGKATYTYFTGWLVEEDY